MDYGFTIRYVKLLTTQKKEELARKVPGIEKKIQLKLGRRVECAPVWIKAGE